jgi:hypothetical protein
LLPTRFLPTARASTHKRETGERLHEKAVFAGAVALAMMGPLFVSEKGFGPVDRFAQDVIVTEGKIAACAPRFV